MTPPRSNIPHPLARLRRRLHRLLVAISLLAVACSSAPTKSQRGAGRLELPLRSSVDGVTYELRDAVFDITGTVDLALDTSKEPEATLLTEVLPPGNYSIELMDGWALIDVESRSTDRLNAALLSDNPLSFEVLPDHTTAILYRFAVDGDPVELSDGRLEVTIEVTQRGARSVIFSELMANPEVLSDADGEWFELTNVGSDPFDLEGCTIDRGSQQLVVTQSLIIEPGQALSFASSPSPGFTPDVTYSGLTLPNSSTYDLSLTCLGDVIDQVAVGGEGWPSAVGVAASLSDEASSPTLNDDPASWCRAADDYNGDKGSPGAANPNCG